MWELVKACIGTLTPVFIMLSPILSYTDQILSMRRNKSSAGFSLDIPLIMLVASLMRIFYWFGSRFEISLLVQAVLMVIMQVILLKVALDHRPSPSAKGGEAALPFAGAQDSGLGWQRPYNFWQWRSPKPYWQFLIYFLAFLVTCELLLSPLESVYPIYSEAIGYIGLLVEAILPLPQVLTNMRAGCIKGFRLSILASWLGGDFTKLAWFFTAKTPIPWPFKFCGILQTAFDCTLGLQYLRYGSGSGEVTVVKEHAVELGQFPAAYKPGVQTPRRSLASEERLSPVLEKDFQD
ncbi:putative membrane protein [Paramyrothecium foliicola]|nr:putative membrane protein [Paramyrothecium foliicola]